MATFPTADGDMALSPGYPELLPAIGTSVDPIVLALSELPLLPLEKSLDFPLFLQVPLVL